MDHQLTTENYNIEYSSNFIKTTINKNLVPIKNDDHVQLQYIRWCEKTGFVGDAGLVFEFPSQYYGDNIVENADETMKDYSSIIITYQSNDLFSIYEYSITKDNEWWHLLEQDLSLDTAIAKAKQYHEKLVA